MTFERPLLALMALVVSVGFAGGRVSTAMLTDMEAANATIGTDTWSYHLHNRPTPPSGATTAQVDLSMTGDVPTATNLYNYSTDLDLAASGRVLRPSALGASETATDRYVNWRTDRVSATRRIDGTIQIRLWSALRAYGAGRGELAVHLRDHDPNTGASTAIASITLDEVSWGGGSGDFVEKLIEIPLSAYDLSAGHQLELKLVAGTGSADDVWIAYDTVGRDSSVRLP